VLHYYEKSAKRLPNRHIEKEASKKAYAAQPEKFKQAFKLSCLFLLIKNK